MSDHALTANRRELYARKMKIKNIKVLIVTTSDAWTSTSGHERMARLEQLVKAQRYWHKVGIAVICLVQLNQDGNLKGAKRMKNECDVMLKLLPLDTDEKRVNTRLRHLKITLTPPMSFVLTRTVTT